MKPIFWCDATLVVTVEGPGGSRRVSIDKPYARIGSHPGSDVALTDAKLPGRWIYLHATQRGVYCVGLFHRATEESRISKWLEPGEFISFDRYRVSAELRDNAHVACRPERNLDHRLNNLGACPRVEVWADGEKIDVVYLQQELTVIGRRFPSHLKIADKLISATHCAFYCHGGEIWMVDLLSSNGTWKRCRRFQAAVMRRCKSINMGRVKLILTDYAGLLPTNTPDRDIRLDPTTQVKLPGEALEWGDTLAFEESLTTLALGDVDPSEPLDDESPAEPGSTDDSVDPGAGGFDPCTTGGTDGSVQSELFHEEHDTVRRDTQSLRLELDTLQESLKTSEALRSDLKAASEQRDLAHATELGALAQARNEADTALRDSESRRASETETLLSELQVVKERLAKTDAARIDLKAVSEECDLAHATELGALAQARNEADTALRDSESRRASETETLQSELRTLKQTLVDSETARGKLQATITRQNTMRAQAERALESAVARADELTANLISLEHEAATLNSCLDKMREERSAVESDLKAARCQQVLETESRCSEIQALHRAAKERDASHADQMGEVERARQAAERRVCDFEVDLHSLCQEASVLKLRLETEINNRAAAEHELEQCRAVNTTELASLHAQIKALDENEALRREIEAADEQREAEFARTLAEAQEVAKQRANQLTAMELELAALQVSFETEVRGRLIAKTEQRDLERLHASQTESLHSKLLEFEKLAREHEAVLTRSNEAHAAELAKSNEARRAAEEHNKELERQRQSLHHQIESSTARADKESESLVVAANLEEWHATLDRERNQWMRQRQQQERELKEQAERLLRREAEVEAQNCEAERQVGVWRHERDQWEEDRATRQQQLDQEAKELTKQRELFHTQFAVASATQGTEQTRPTERTHELEQRPAESVARTLMLETDQEELTPEPDHVLQPLSSSKRRSHASEDDSIEQKAAPERDSSDDMCEEMTNRLVKLNDRKRGRFLFWKRS